MIFKLFAIAALALGAAGIVLLLNKILGGRLPKWALPAAIAGSIFFFTIFDEYNWHDRKIKALADQQTAEFVVIGTRSPTAIWRPWSYINAPVTAIMAINKNNMTEIQSGIYQGFLGSSTMYGTGQVIPVAIDCDRILIGQYFGELDDVRWGQLDHEPAGELCG